MSEYRVACAPGDTVIVECNSQPKAPKDTLRELLSDSRYEWRKTSTLAKAIAKSVWDTKAILNGMGDVESSDTGFMYRLTSPTASVEAALLRLLSDTRYVWRKASTLATETGCSRNTVEDILADMPGVKSSWSGSMYCLTRRS